MKSTASNQSISWFYQRHKELVLELSPDFQRNPVWLQPQQEYLIETILLSLPMPEIYMVNRIKPSGDSKFVIVDGQQRLRTILEYIEGKFELRKDINDYKGVRKFSDMTDEQKGVFWRYSIVVRDLEDSKDIEIRDLFQRLNKYSFVLNEQELRNAKFKGAFLETVQKIVEHDFWVSSGLFSANDIRRMLDLEYISVLLVTLIGGIFNRKERLDEFYGMYENDFEDSAYYQNYFERIIGVFEDIFPDIKKTKWKNKANFFALFLCIDELDIKKEDSKIICDELTAFEKKVQAAKTEPESADDSFTQYLDAATYGTNDKEKRIRRFKILRDYLKSKLMISPGELFKE